VPPEWYDGDAARLEELVENLLKRRMRVRELIEAFQESSREPFPNWGKKKETVRMEQFVEAKWDDELKSGRVM
jgi:hypothetical protein